jgi:hypothetical protein
MLEFLDPQTPALLQTLSQSTILGRRSTPPGTILPIISQKKEWRTNTAREMPDPITLTAESKNRCLHRRNLLMNLRKGVALSRVGRALGGNPLRQVIPELRLKAHRSKTSRSGAVEFLLLSPLSQIPQRRVKMHLRKLSNQQNRLCMHPRMGCRPGSPLRFLSPEEGPLCKASS